jgi:hypothetical protein
MKAAMTATRYRSDSIGLSAATGGAIKVKRLPALDA